MKGEVKKKSEDGIKRILYFDFLRAFAPVAVIWIHVCPNMYRFHLDISSSDFMMSNAVQWLARWAVPIFIMMSGALFLNPEKQFSFKKHLKKNVLRLVIVYLFWSVVYATVAATFSFSLGSQGWWKRFLSIVCGVHYYHLWYLIVLVLLYLMVPVLRKITANRALMNYFLILGIVICFALPAIGEYCTLILKRVNDSSQLPVVGVLKGIEDITGYMAGKLRLDFMVYFVLGHFLHSEDLSRKLRIVLYVFGIVAMINIILISMLRFNLLGYDRNGATEENINVAVLTFSSAIFIAAKYGLQKVRKLPKWIMNMAKYSFGIYLCHALFIDFVLYKRNVNPFPVGHKKLELLLFVAATVVIYIASYLVTWAISKIPLLRKIV